MAQRNPRPWPTLNDSERERLKARLLDRMNPDPLTGCWNWKLALRNGYGSMFMCGKSWPAHRVSYLLFVGPFKTSLDIDHLCRNPQCVNPDHLEPVDPKTNLFRSTNHVVQQVLATHCPKGHPYTAENLYIRPSGRRACRACQREWSSDRHRRIRAGEHVPVPRAVYEKRDVA